MTLVDGGIPLFSIRGIPVRLHVLFVVVLIFQVLTSAFSGPWWMLYWFLLLGPILLLTVLIHELGHSLAARSVGSEAHGILLWPLGGLAYLGHISSPRADMCVAVAGPLTHVPMSILWLLMLLAAWYGTYGNVNISMNLPYPDAQHLGVAICIGSLMLNLSLMLFNLLVPAYPLDGGRILVDALLMAGMDPRKAAIVTVAVALPLAAAVIVWGIVSLTFVTVFVGVWIAYSSMELVTAMRKGQLHTHPLFVTSSGAGAGVGLPTSTASAAAAPHMAAPVAQSMPPLGGLPPTGLPPAQPPPGVYPAPPAYAGSVAGGFHLFGETPASPPRGYPDRGSTL